MRKLLSVLFAAGPFGVAFVRAVQTGHDVRLLWMAVASFVGATAATTVANAGSRKLSALLTWSSAFLIATLLAGTTAWLRRATAAPGIWAVAAVFGLCSAVSSVLMITREPRRRT
jgi:hypothetical protein